MRNKYKNLQNRGQSQNDNSYIKTEKLNHLNTNKNINNINKNSFISNFDNKEKIEKMLNQPNDKDKKSSFIEKRYAQSFISNDKISIRSSNHNMLYSIYKKENKDNLENKEEIKKEINNKNKSEYFSNKYYNSNHNIKITNKEKQKEKTEIIRDTINNKRQINNASKYISHTKNSISLNNNDIKNINNKKNNIEINIRDSKPKDNNNIKEKVNDYKRFKWDIKEHKLKIMNDNTTNNYNSTTNINSITSINNNISNANNNINLITERKSVKRLNYIKNKEKEKETKVIINKMIKEEKPKEKILSNYNSHTTSKIDIFSNNNNIIKKKVTYRSRRSTGEDDNNNKKEDNQENKKEDTKENKKKNIKENKNEEIKDNKKDDNNNIEENEKKKKYIKELTKTPNILNNNKEEPKTEDCISHNRKIRRYFYFKSNKNKNININKNNEKDDIITKEKEEKKMNEIEKLEDKKEKEEKEEIISKKEENSFSPIMTLSPITQITESNISPENEIIIKSPKSHTAIKKISTKYKMTPKQSFKEIIHEVNSNKDFHESFTNIFQSCKNDINNKKSSQDLNKSFSCFSNTDEIKLNLDGNNNLNNSQILKVNLKKKEKNMNTNLIYKKKMNLIKSISNQYKKSIPHFIFNSINNINNSNKRNYNDLSCGNIINNNTYNTTLNIFTEKHISSHNKSFNNDNNLNEIKRHIRNNSDIQKNKQPFYFQIFYDKEKELNIKKSISNNTDLTEINNNNIKYKINIEILYIIETKLQNILFKLRY